MSGRSTGYRPSRSGRDSDRDRDRYADGPRDRDRYEDSSRDRDRPGEGSRDYRREPPSRSGRASAGLPPPPERDRDRDRDRPRDGSRNPRSLSPAPQQDRDGQGARGTPPSGRRKAPGASNPLVAELLKQGKLLASSRTGDEPSQPQRSAQGDASSSEETEAGEIRDEAAPESRDDRDAPARKRKHSPIVWNPGPAKSAKATEDSQPLSILERTQKEAAALKEMQRAMEEDIDPDAPALMKGSPVLSDEEPDDSRPAGYMDSPRPGPGVSRWAVLEDDDPGTGLGTSPARDVSQSGLSNGQPPISGTELVLSDSGNAEDEPGTGKELSVPPAARYNMRKACRDVHEFEKIEKISEGTYGVVYKAREKSTGRIVALKRVKMEHETDGFPITSVREINILLNFHHPNIVNVEEIVVGRTADQIYMVMEYADHDLKSLMDDKKKFSQPFSAGQVKNLMRQLLMGVDFLHQNWVLHRDLKTSNILYNSKGQLKLCDFGMARQYGEPLANYTPLVITLWYRPPELLFGELTYSTAVDMWSVGCIMGEILTGQALLKGQGDFDQIDKMIQLLGTPKEEDWPGFKKLPNASKINLKEMPSQLKQRFTTPSTFGGGATLTEAGFDLLSRLLTWDPSKRITAKEALQHRWFTEAPLPVDSALMPTFAKRKAG